jgi:PAS domain S-box-containing protein
VPGEESFKRMVELSNRAFARRREMAKQAAAANDSQVRQTEEVALLDWQSIFEALPAPVLLGDMKGNLLYTNSAGAALIGQTAAAIRHLTVLDVVAARPEWTVSQWERFNQEGFWRGEFDCLRGDGSTVQVGAVVKRADVGRGSLFVAVMYDLSSSNPAFARATPALR